VKSNAVGTTVDEEATKREIMEYVKKHKTKYKWVQEIEFIKVIPKSPSGKILRRILRDSDRVQRKKQSIYAKI
jgi:acyl-coenzyme A synthetase/AMP-(fatty) acid ligase